MREETIVQIGGHLKGVISKRPGQVLGLWGEAGVGKTFTVQALLKQTLCQSLSLPATTTASALLQLLPRSKRQAWSEALRSHLIQGQPLESPAILDAIVASLQSLAPFVLHLEDIHEANPERLELICQLAQRLVRVRGVGLLATSRTVLPEPFKSYRMVPFDKLASNALLEHQSSGPLPQAGLDWVFAKAQGNALFTLEFWRYLTRQGYFWSDGQSWHWRFPPEGFVPASVEAIIAQTLSDLDERQRSIVEARAFLNEIEPRLLNPLWAKVAGLEPAELRQIKTAREVQEIIGNSGFVHPLIREVIIRETPSKRRQLYSKRAIETLADSPQIAVYFVDGAGLESAQQRDLLERAAETAEQTGNTVQAGRWLSRAVELAQGDSRETLALRASRYLVGVDIPEATRLLQIAHQQNPSNHQTAITLAGYFARLGHNQESEQILAGLPQDATTKASWFRTLLQLRESQRDQKAVLELWSQHPELQGPLDPDVAYAVAFAKMEQGDAKGAEQLAGIALELPQLQLRHRVKLTSVCGLSWRLLDNLDQARYWMDESVGLARESGQPRLLASSLHNRQIVLQMLGLTSEPAADLQESAELYQSLGFTLHYASSLTQLGTLLGVMGQFEPAEAKLLEAHQILQRFENTTFICTCEANLSYLYLRWHPPHALQLAQKYARLCLNHARLLESNSRPLGYALNLAGLVAIELNQLKEAMDLLEESLNLEGLNSANRSEAYGYKALVLEAQGLKGKAIEHMELARSLSSGKQARELDLELMRLKGQLEEAQAALQWFEQHNHQEWMHVMQQKWPELKPNVALPAEESFEDEISLYLRVLGVPQIELGGEAITYRGKKRLELLSYLLEARIAGRQEVNVLELMEVFYPEMPENQAKSTVRQQMYLIRNSLGANSIQSTANGYALGAVHSDAEDFLGSGDAQLWQGVYLQGLSDGWNAAVRDALTIGLRSQLHSLLEVAPAEAARLGKILLELEPYDQEALRFTLTALKSSGQGRSAAQMYAQQQKQWLEIGEKLPDAIDDFLRLKAEVV